MSKPINWQSVFNAIASAEAKQSYAGYSGRMHHWTLEASLSAETAAQIMAYMEAHGASTKRFTYDMNAAFRTAGDKWKFNNKVLPILVMVGALGCLTLIGALIETNPWIGIAITLLILALWYLKGHRHRRLKSIWKNGGSVESRLDAMCALSAASPISANLIPLLVILVMAIPLAVLCKEPQLPDYLEANSLMKQGEYEDAAKLYGSLKDYRESRQKAKDAWNAYGDERLSRGDNYSALEAYENSGDATRIASAYYAYGKDYLDKEDFDRAVTNFQKAGDYLDAADRAGEILYAQAEAAIAADDIRTAVEKFTEAGDYSDAKARIGQIYYDKAVAFLADGKPEAAAQHFALAGEYEDAAQRSSDLYAQLIADALAAHDYATAVRVYTDLGDEESAQNVRYQEAVWHYDSGNYAYAYLCFSEMKDYAPETGRSVSDYLADEKVIAGADDTLFMVPGNTVVFGKYEQDNNMSNGQEPIEWIVLDCDGAKSLLRTRYAIDTCHDDLVDYRWAQSDCRAWLNSGFLADAFSADEQSAILTTKLSNSIETAHPKFGADGGEDTEDRVFLLSYQEAVRYLGEKPKEPRCTDYAQKARGIAAGSKSCDSLLRSVNIVTNVSKNTQEIAEAYINWGGLYTANATVPKHVCVQPVIWVDLSVVSAMNH